eukprot:gnl/MRDRNA2_/MRDRNA2_122555_c0_seq1.p1 gnl/MRDRNA2_/MRDRNA2_122555_c0~~gnl/MRDRNA2_/MRDRNA2_122555_c0_seq1.p1  ORF type:complete len:135 (+),score=5.50 gnl/MRDRNA2_/MRDRNA2_122555_c0_seq1:111-515(+)
MPRPLNLSKVFTFLRKQKFKVSLIISWMGIAVVFAGVMYMAPFAAWHLRSPVALATLAFLGFIISIGAYGMFVGLHYMIQRKREISPFLLESRRRRKPESADWPSRAAGVRLTIPTMDSDGTAETLGFVRAIPE